MSSNGTTLLKTVRTIIVGESSITIHAWDIALLDMPMICVGLLKIILFIKNIRKGVKIAITLAMSSLSQNSDIMDTA